MREHQILAFMDEMEKIAALHGRPPPSLMASELLKEAVDWKSIPGAAWDYTKAAPGAMWEGIKATPGRAYRGAAMEGKGAYSFAQSALSNPVGELSSAIRQRVAHPVSPYTLPYSQLVREGGVQVPIVGGLLAAHGLYGTAKGLLTKDPTGYSSRGSRVLQHLGGTLGAVAGSGHGQFVAPMMGYHAGNYLGRMAGKGYDWLVGHKPPEQQAYNIPPEILNRMHTTRQV